MGDLYAEYQPALLRYLRGRAGEDADDLASETWISAAQGLGTFHGGADEFRAWLFTIGRHRLIDARRRDKRRPVVSASELPATEMAATEPSPEDLVANASAGEAAARRIARLLPPDQADVILLRVVGGLSVEEVAAIMDKKPGTIRVLQSRGLKRLQKYL